MQGTPEEILNAFYSATDIAQRKALLAEYQSLATDDSVQPLRETLLDLRYQGREDADKFLWYYVNFPYVYKNASSRFFKKSAQKEFAESLQALGFLAAEEYGAEGTQVLYQEFVNASKRFLGVCADDKSYKRKLLGLSSINEQQTREKMAKDVWVLSTGLQQAFPEQSERLAPFAKANVDAFTQLYPDAAQLLAAISST